MNVAPGWPLDMLIVLPLAAAFVLAAWPRKGNR